MAVLQASRVIATCDTCRARFDPVRGGVCPSCRRLLCAEHYYGAPWRRVLGLLGMAPQCAACRAGHGPTAPPPAAER